MLNHGAGRYHTRVQLFRSDEVETGAVPDLSQRRAQAARLPCLCLRVSRRMRLEILPLRYGHALSATHLSAR